ncbi:hypothetical protein Acr_20g0009780 [Actinidia rufa]|uniref:CCHC-type domain-containing protein n=1 Tax=Actinidia rufa TaxID=165716 RepID=A0A7J0GEC8_9ERIC|nr:hypothetical protein Acr_20g0009780 [Actinidia rufa]
MPPRRGRGRRGAAEPEDRVDRIERILEGLVQVVHDVHNNNNHDDAPQQPAMPMPGAGAMPRSSSGNSSAQQRNIVSQGSSRSNELPTCPTCQKKHWGECRMGSRACYGCGQEGHQIRDCPNEEVKFKELEHRHLLQSSSLQAERRNNQPRQGRAFALVPGNTPATTSVVSGILPICGQPAHILMDSESIVHVRFVSMNVPMVNFEGVIVPPPYLIAVALDCELKRVVFHSLLIQVNL